MKVCDMNCFNCKFPDCIKNDTYSEKSRYCNRSEQAKANQRKRAKEKRDEARAKGLCIICRKKPMQHGSKCYECWLRQKRYDKRKNTGQREQWLRDGKCYFCGKEPIKGKKVCAVHYPALKQHGERMAELPQTIKAQRDFVRWHLLLRGVKS